MMDDSWTEGRLFCGPGCGKLYQDMDGCTGCEVSAVVGLICAIYAWREGRERHAARVARQALQRSDYQRVAAFSLLVQIRDLLKDATPGTLDYDLHELLVQYLVTTQ